MEVVVNVSFWPIALDIYPKKIPKTFNSSGLFMQYFHDIALNYIE